MTIITDLRAQIKTLENKIKDIQDQCAHPQAALDIKHKGDTGNWDRSQDGYWSEYHCKLCDKQWTEASA